MSRSDMKSHIVIYGQKSLQENSKSHIEVQRSHQKCKSNEGNSRVIGDIKGHSSRYKVNIITQANGFWMFTLWRASLGFSSLAQERTSFFGEARSDLIFHYWSQWYAIVTMNLDLSPYNQNLFEPTHFHACIMNNLRLFYRCLQYMFCSHVLRKLNYFIGFSTYIIEWVLYLI